MPFIKKDKLLRRKILNFFGKIKIKYLNLTFAKILVLIGIFLTFASLTMPWFSLPYNEVDSQNAFSGVLGLNGYLIVLIPIFNIFVIFSNSLKKKIKLFLNLSLNEKKLIFYSNLLLLLFSINSILTIKGLKLFSNDITFYSGASMGITGILIMVLGGYLNFIKKSEGFSDFVGVNEINISEKKSEKNKAMKLPF